MASQIPSLIQALGVFSSAADKASIDAANTWLQDFQHTEAAWATCNELLLSPDAPPAAKLFAAQTFRSKVTYDLNQLAPEHILSFRDTLLTALQQFHAGPRVVIVQLCLAVSGLALQLPVWDAVKSMIEAFGRNPATVPVLLQFLTLLPEELSGNTRIPVTDDEYRERAASLLTGNAAQVIELLAMYIQAPGVTQVVQTQVFACLRSWLVAGEASASSLAQTPLFDFAFNALDSDLLFDAAVDVVCEIIHETQEIDDNMPVIEAIVPKVIALKSKIQQHYEDPDRIRGYAKIFTEAGETYRLLLIQHTNTFFPIVDAIGECSAYPDLDIVPITFAFWLRLAQLLNNRPSFDPVFLTAFRSLMSVVIRHLRFPSNPDDMIGQEAENFRSFRHVMGDTLKDCCLVLGTAPCLLTTYQMITACMAGGSDLVAWQDIEAPLFAMRSMGAEIDPTDSDAVPKIMDLIPVLPAHPRVRYAALLIISRYTEWINKHPAYIPAQLEYISKGFNDSDTEVCAAAGQALKYLCQDCKKHMANVLPQLHQFLGADTGKKLLQVDRQQVYEAIAHVISAMPMEQAAETLRTFALDLLKEIHAVANKPTMADKAELQGVCDALENLESMLAVIQGFGEELPRACQSTCEESWLVFNTFLTKYGSSYDLSERTMRVLRHGLKMFGDAAITVAPSVLTTMTTLFESTGFPSYLWISGKLVGGFGNDENPALRNAFRELYARSTNKVVEILGNKEPREIPDVLEDYVQLLLQMVEFAPDIFFESPSFPLAFQAALVNLTVVHSDIIFATLDLFRTIVTHPSLDARTSSRTPPQQYPVYAAAINSVIEQQGFVLLGRLLSGLVGEFPEDSTSAVVSIFRALSALWPTQLAGWLQPVLRELPIALVPDAAKNEFFQAVSKAITEGQVDKVKYAIIDLHRTSRKARDRRRVGPALEGVV